MSETIEIKRRVIEGEQPGPHLLISGGVHGDEYEPMAAIRALGDRIDANELKGKLTLVPVMNEPAFAIRDRVAPDGLDLARTFPGDPDGSVTERVAHAGAQLIRSADYYIDLHTGGRVAAILSLSGYSLHPDPEILETQRRMAQAFNLPLIWGTSPDLQGRSLSVARDAKVPAIYTELGKGNGCDPKGVGDYIDGCLNVMAELGMLDRPRPESRVRHVVEDPRPASGHLQINYNAQASGFFEPAVGLADRVSAGDTLGVIVDPLGQVLETVTSTQTGLVLLIRALPRVDEGDNLAVILEIEP